MGGQVSPADTSVATMILWLAGLGTLLSVCTALWTIFSGPSKKNSDKISEMTSKISAQDVEIQRLRDRVEAMPDAGTMHRLELALTRMEGHIGQLDERLRPALAIAERMQDLLIEQGKR
jgi:Protein of unknown function (DUF2730)